MKTILWRPLLLALLSSLLFAGTPARAEADGLPTAEQMQALTAGGQLYLFNSFVQHPTDATKGYWGNQSFPETAAAVAALLESGKYSDPLYAAKIDKAIVFIKGFVRTETISSVEYHPIYQSNSTYENGLALVALSLYGELTSQDAAYKTLVQDAMNYAIAAQYSGGGWGYYPLGDPDMSNTQFGVMGLYYGSHYLGAAIDPSVAGSWPNKFYNILKAESEGGLQYADGHYRYASGWDYTNLSMTGAGLWSLAMISKGTSTEATNAIGWFTSNYALLVPADTLAVDTWKNGSSKDYYMVYAVAKALSATLGPANNLGTQPWANDLKTALFDQAVAGSASTCSAVHDVNERCWVDQNWLSGYPSLATSFVLMSLSFADVSAESIEKNLPDPPAPTYPILNQGMVRLQTTDGVTISVAGRANAGDHGVQPVGVKLPVGSFDFTLNHVPVGGTAVLTLTPPAGVLDPTNPDSFVNADGTLKAGLSWFKVVGGTWTGTVPIVVDLVARTITVTLRDGGPEDADGLANGTIVDPGAPGYGDEATTTTTTTATDDGLFGCSMGHNGVPDPTLPLLAVGALAYLLRRRA